MRHLILLFAVLLFSVPLKAQEFTTIFETSEGKETATYQQTIAYYQNLCSRFKTLHIQEIGLTDAGLPLHLITYSPTELFDFNQLRSNHRILLINNGIHPGESDGIDATMMLMRDLALGRIDTPKRTVIAAIAIYNIGGSLNRNSTSRTNQNGPESYGFRGNARNYDLNRDFIKADTRNAQTFAKIFHQVQPDVFIDNHVSNGADYQYTLTHLFTQHNKLGNALGEFIEQTMRPELEKDLATKQWDITPYVNVFNQVPENGFSQFMDYPRYSTGYTTLWNTLGMMVETHMLKPYKQRVLGTYELMRSMIGITDHHADAIAQLRAEAFKKQTNIKTYPLQWKTDKAQHSNLQFKGYEGQFQTSELTGKKRLKYDRKQPFTKNVKYYNTYQPKLSIEVPKAYVIPQGWWPIIDRLKLNQVEMSTIEKDTVINVEAYRIETFKTNTTAYEGHFPHNQVKLTKSTIKKPFRAGDFIISTNQKAFRYLIETLEPQAYDSFFTWNFFDTVLQQKEHFSPYVWEDKAKELLEKNPELKAQFLAKKQEDESFANNWYAQLDWLHKQSAHYEKAHMQYPVYRILN